MLVKLMSKLFVNGEMRLDKLEGIIFDKDGTLIDIHHYWGSIIKIRATLIASKWLPKKESVERELIEAMGVDFLSGKMKPTGPVGIKPRSFIVGVASEVVRSHGVLISNDEMESIFLEVDKQTSKDMSPFLRLLPGVVELLGNLEKCGVAVAIATTDLTDRARLAMESLKIDHFFSEIVGGDLVENTKPSPDLALMIVDRLGVSSDRVVVVGDHPVDIGMGQAINAGLNIGVLTGLSHAVLFDNLGCLVIKDLKGIEVAC